MKPPFSPSWPRLLLASAVTVVGADLAPDDVRNAMNLGIRYLQSSQHANGTWSEYAGQEGGITALCTLALLNAGESPKEPHVATGARLSPQAAIPRRPMSSLCKPWSFAVRPLPTTRSSSAAMSNGWRIPRSRAARPTAKAAGPTARCLTDGPSAATARTVNSHCWPCTRPAAWPNPAKSTSLSTARPGNASAPIGSTTSDEEDGTLGLLQAHGRHRQHDLCGHRLADDRRRRPPRAGRQSVGRPDRRLLLGPLGRPGANRAGHRLAGGDILPSMPIRPRRRPAAASGTTIISTDWSVPVDSPHGGRSASTIGIAKGPPAWSRPSAPSSREAPGKAVATPKTTKTSPPAWPCCSSPRDVGPC